MVRKILDGFLKEHGIVSDSVVDVAFVGEKKMIEIAQKYLKEKSKEAHNVLSFTASEVSKNFIYPPEDKIYIGEIVVCYPKVVEEAKRESKRIDAKVKELVEHAALHLLGIHHK